MLYIVTALKPEAQAFVDRYSLKKDRLKDFTIFKNDEILLIVSGIGVKNSMMATQTLINHFDITDDDIYLNIGICGASKNYNIGQLISINSITYNSQRVDIQNKDGKHILCLDEESDDSSDEIVDMECYGFYDAVIHSPAIKNFHILKVVSDHFEPQKVTKDGTKSLVFNAIDDINILLYPEAN